MCFALYLSFLDIYKLKRNPWVLSKWISHLSFVRRHSPTEASDQSSFLPSATTHCISSSTTISFIMISCYDVIFVNTVFIKWDKSWREKQFRQLKRTFPRTNCCFCFSFCCQKAEIYLPSARWQNTCWKYFNLRARRRRINFLSTTTARLREKGQTKYSWHNL